MCRKEWLEALLQIVTPVLEALSEERLKISMPLEFHGWRAEYAPLEAFGRSMLGLAPWLEAEGLEGEERKLQERYRILAVRCLEAASDPNSADFMGFQYGGQNLVDTAFLAHALLRAPKHLTGVLTEQTRKQLIAAFRSTRQFVAYNTNWIFFSAMVEAGLALLKDLEYDKMRIASALRTFDGWYKGDGVYGDGAAFHWDYYNSFVIQPMYVDLTDFFEDNPEEFQPLRERVAVRAARYATVLERMIAPDGTYPILGRSICYRFGAFQMLAQAALQHRLEPGLPPAQVRCALSAVIRRGMEGLELFDEAGWLTPGVCGYQPELAEEYITAGSLYLCSSVFLPLGLAPTDPFWSGKSEAWTSKKIWSGSRNGCIDHALD